MLGKAERQVSSCKKKIDALMQKNTGGLVACVSTGVVVCISTLSSGVCGEAKTTTRVTHACLTWRKIFGPKNCMTMNIGFGKQMSRHVFLV